MRLTQYEAWHVVPVITATEEPLIEFRARSRLHAEAWIHGTARESAPGQPDMP